MSVCVCKYRERLHVFMCTGYFHMYHTHTHTHTHTQAPRCEHPHVSLPAQVATDDTPDHDTSIIHLEFSVRGTHFLSLSSDGVCILRVLTSVGASLTSVQLTDAADPAVACRFSPDGMLIATLHTFGALFWSCQTGDLVGRLAQVYTLATVTFPEEYAGEIAPPLSPHTDPPANRAPLTPEERHAIEALRAGAEVVLHENNVLEVRTQSQSQSTNASRPPSRRASTPGGIMVPGGGTGSRLHTPGSVRFVDTVQDRPSTALRGRLGDGAAAHARDHLDEHQRVHTEGVAHRHAGAVGGEVDYLRIDDDFGSRPPTADSTSVRDWHKYEERFTHSGAVEHAEGEDDGAFAYTRESRVRGSGRGSSSQDSETFIEMLQEDATHMEAHGVESSKRDRGGLLQRRPSRVTSSAGSTRPSLPLSALLEDERDALDASLHSHLATVGETSPKRERESENEQAWEGHEGKLRADGMPGEGPDYSHQITGLDEYLAGAGRDGEIQESDGEEAAELVDDEHDRGDDKYHVRGDTQQQASRQQAHVLPSGDDTEGPAASTRRPHGEASYTRGQGMRSGEELVESGNGSEAGVRDVRGGHGDVEATEQEGVLVTHATQGDDACDGARPPLHRVEADAQHSQPTPARGTPSAIVVYAGAVGGTEHPGRRGHARVAQAAYQSDAEPLHSTEQETSRNSPRHEALGGDQSTVETTMSDSANTSQISDSDGHMSPSRQLVAAATKDNISDAASDKSLSTVSYRSGAAAVFTLDSLDKERVMELDFADRDTPIWAFAALFWELEAKDRPSEYVKRGREA
jgi:hypothetical protein